MYLLLDMAISNFGDIFELFLKIRQGCADHLCRDTLKCCSYQGLQVVPTIIVLCVVFILDEPL